LSIGASIGVSYAVSVWVSAILFHLFFGSVQYQYFCRQVC